MPGSTSGGGEQEPPKAKAAPPGATKNGIFVRPVAVAGIFRPPTDEAKPALPEKRRFSTLSGDLTSCSSDSPADDFARRRQSWDTRQATPFGQNLLRKTTKNTSEKITQISSEADGLAAVEEDSTPVKSHQNNSNDVSSCTGKDSSVKFSLNANSVTNVASKDLSVHNSDKSATHVECSFALPKNASKLNSSDLKETTKASVKVDARPKDRTEQSKACNVAVVAQSSVEKSLTVSQTSKVNSISVSNAAKSLEVESQKFTDANCTSIDRVKPKKVYGLLKRETKTENEVQESSIKLQPTIESVAQETLIKYGTKTKNVVSESSLKLGSKTENVVQESSIKFGTKTETVIQKATIKREIKTESVVQETSLKLESKSNNVVQETAIKRGTKADNTVQEALKTDSTSSLKEFATAFPPAKVKVYGLAKSNVQKEVENTSVKTTAENDRVFLSEGKILVSKNEDIKSEKSSPKVTAITELSSQQEKSKDFTKAESPKKEFRIGRRTSDVIAAKIQNIFSNVSTEKQPYKKSKPVIKDKTVPAVPSDVNNDLLQVDKSSKFQTVNKDNVPVIVPHKTTVTVQVKDESLKCETKSSQVNAAQVSQSESKDSVKQIGSKSTGLDYNSTLKSQETSSVLKTVNQTNRKELSVAKSDRTSVSVTLKPSDQTIVKSVADRGKIRDASLLQISSQKEINTVESGPNADSKTLIKATGVSTSITIGSPSQKSDVPKTECKPSTRPTYLNTSKADSSPALKTNDPKSVCKPSVKTSDLNLPISGSSPVVKTSDPKSDLKPLIKTSDLNNSKTDSSLAVKTSDKKTDSKLSAKTSDLNAPNIDGSSSIRTSDPKANLKPVIKTSDLSSRKTDSSPLLKTCDPKTDLKPLIKTSDLNSSKTDSSLAVKTSDKKADSKPLDKTSDLNAPKTDCSPPLKTSDPKAGLNPVIKTADLSSPKTDTLPSLKTCDPKTDLKPLIKTSDLSSSKTDSAFAVKTSDKKADSKPSAKTSDLNSPKTDGSPSLKTSDPKAGLKPVIKTTDLSSPKTDSSPSLKTSDLNSSKTESALAVKTSDKKTDSKPSAKTSVLNSPKTDGSPSLKTSDPKAGLKPVIKTSDLSSPKTDLKPLINTLDLNTSKPESVLAVKTSDKKTETLFKTSKVNSPKTELNCSGTDFKPSAKSCQRSTNEEDNKDVSLKKSKQISNSDIIKTAQQETNKDKIMASVVESVTIDHKSSLTSRVKEIQKANLPAKSIDTSFTKTTSVTAKDTTCKSNIYNQSVVTTCNGELKSVLTTTSTPVSVTPNVLKNSNVGEKLTNGSVDSKEAVQVEITKISQDMKTCVQGVVPTVNVMFRTKSPQCSKDIKDENRKMVIVANVESSPNKTGIASNGKIIPIDSKVVSPDINQSVTNSVNVSTLDNSSKLSKNITTHPIVNLQKQELASVTLSQNPNVNTTYTASSYSSTLPNSPSPKPVVNSPYLSSSYINTLPKSPSPNPFVNSTYTSSSYINTLPKSPSPRPTCDFQIVDLDIWSKKFQQPDDVPRAPLRRRAMRDSMPPSLPLRSSVGSRIGSLKRFDDTPRVPRSPSQSSMSLGPGQRYSYTEMLSKVCSMGVLPTESSFSNYKSCSSSSSQVSELWSDLSEEQSAATHATEILDAETTERMRLEKEVQELQSRYSHIQQRSDKMELEMMEARVYRTELNGDLSEDEDAEGNSSIYKQKYERAVRDMEMMKRRIQQQHEEEMEQKVMVKKATDKKLAEALEDVEEERQVANQWKRKAQKLGSELQDLRLMLEEQMARNGELEKKQRRFDSELSAAQEEIKKERLLREKLVREKDQALHEKYSLEQDLQSTRIDMDLQHEKITQLNRELDELTLSSKGEEEVTQLKRTKQELERKTRDQEEELEELAAQVQMLEQTKLRLEMSLEKLRQEHRRESSVREEEIEEIRASSSKKIKNLEAQLEAEQDERHQLVKQKHEIERRIYEMTDQPPPHDPEVERRLRRDLKRTRALLRDAQSMLEHSRDGQANKTLIRQLKNQLEDAEFATAAAVKARQTADCELQELQLQLEEVTRAKNENESRCLQLSREKSAIQTQSEEMEEEMAEVMKKYKAVVAQMSIDQKSIAEQNQQIADLEAERQMLKEQLSEVSHKFEHLAGQSEDTHKIHRLDGKVRELDSKLDLEQTTRSRLENQISRLKELNDRAREEADALRNKELQAQESVRRLQRQIRDLREDYAALQQKEADGYRKQHELEMAFENTDGDLQVTKNDLRLACQRIQDLQNALEEDLDSGTDVPDDSGSDSDSSFEMSMMRSQCMTPVQRCESVSSNLSFDMDGRRSRTSSFSHELSAFSRMMLRRTSMDFLG